MADPAYRVFLSQSGKDKDFVKELYRRLTRDGVTCFFDIEVDRMVTTGLGLSSVRWTSASLSSSSFRRISATPSGWRSSEPAASATIPLAATQGTAADAAALPGPLSFANTPSGRDGLIYE